MMLLVIAFFSGVLTVLAPCVLPLLPIVLGASAEDGNNKKIPLVIIASLSVSIILFSIVLKASTILIDVPPSFWKSFSGGVLIALGIITILPNLWKNISSKLGFSGKSNQILGKTQAQKGMMKYILMGFALGPVFSSCSPTYALILAIILPAGILVGMGALISYTFGLACILFAIAIFGQKLIKKLKWASNPSGIFKKSLGIIFVVVGLAIVSGFDKKIEAAMLNAGFLNTTTFEQAVIDELKLDELPEDEGSYKEELSQSERTGQTCNSTSCGKQSEGSLSFLSPDNVLEKKETSLAKKKGFPAPDFAGLSDWINSQGYESISQLEGKVVMVDFWTLGCINCINTHGETNKLYSEFKEQGLEIIGIHAPEFAYEQKIENVEKAVQEFNMEFPIALDNDFKTWNRYNNRYWPAFYIIGKGGDIRYTHFGEGGYEEKRQVISELLAENL